jgi:RNA polymerase sigma factor (sigma-70 family)
MRKGFPISFIERFGSDLLGQALVEFSSAVADGKEVPYPTGWLIHCAWRRAQNELTRQGRTPQFCRSEETWIECGHPDGSAENQALERDRMKRLHEALANLEQEQRTLIMLVYFQGLSVRGASRVLGLSPSRAERRHSAALARLREVLMVGFEESEQTSPQI